jgi:hypothetical protein
MDRVVIFVADDEDKEKYMNSTGSSNVVVGVKGLTNQRRFISEYFSKGERIWSMDDDVKAVERLKLLEKLDSLQKPLDHPAALEPVLELDSLIQRGFRMAERRDVGLWGLYAVRNRGFLHPKAQVGNLFCMGHSYGHYAGDSAFDRITDYNFKDDYYLGLHHMVNGNGTLRFNNYCVNAKQHSGAGGTNEDMLVKLEGNNRTVDKICAEFSELASVKMRRTKDEWLSKYKEIRLTNKVKETIDMRVDCYA